MKFKIGDCVKVTLSTGDPLYEEFSGKVGTINSGPDESHGFHIKTGPGINDGLRCVERELTPAQPLSSDPVNRPAHYTNHPSGIECIQITEHMGFNLGNALKYIWRCDLKKDAIEDLKKARWYIDREIQKREDSI